MKNIFMEGYTKNEIGEPQSFAKYLRKVLVFMWGSALREKFNFCFLGDFY